MLSITGYCIHHTSPISCKNGSLCCRAWISTVLSECCFMCDYMCILDHQLALKPLDIKSNCNELQFAKLPFFSIKLQLAM